MGENGERMRGRACFVRKERKSNGSTVTVTLFPRCYVSLSSLGFHLQLSCSLHLFSSFSISGVSSLMPVSYSLFLSLFLSFSLLFFPPSSLLPVSLSICCLLFLFSSCLRLVQCRALAMKQKANKAYLKLEQREDKSGKEKCIIDCRREESRDKMKSKRSEKRISGSPLLDFSFFSAKA